MRHLTISKVLYSVTLSPEWRRAQASSMRTVRAMTDDPWGVLPLFDAIEGAVNEDSIWGASQAGYVKEAESRKRPYSIHHDRVVTPGIGQ